MIIHILKYLLRFVVLVLVQVLFLKNIPFLGFATPYIYVLFILTFPIKCPRTLFLLIAFALGATIDIFLDTLGLHIFSTVLIAFLRPYILNLFITKDNTAYFSPSVKFIGLAPFIKYTIVMVFIHHTVLFSLEAFSFAHFWLLLLKVLLNVTFSSLLIFATQINPRKK